MSNDDVVTCERPACQETELVDVSRRIGDTLWIYWVCAADVGWANGQLDLKAGT